MATLMLAQAVTCALDELVRQKEADSCFEDSVSGWGIQTGAQNTRDPNNPI